MKVIVLEQMQESRLCFWSLVLREKKVFITKINLEHEDLVTTMLTFYH